MLKKSLLMTLGAGYICTQVSNVKRVDIKDEICITKDVEKNNTAIFITENKSIITLLALSLDKENKKVDILEIDKEKYINKNEVNTINNVNYELGLNINNYLKFDLLCIEDITKHTGDIQVKLSAADIKLIDSIKEKSEDKKYNLNSKDMIQYLTREGTGKISPKEKRQKKIARAIANKVFTLSTKDFIKVIGTVLPNIETTFETKELISLGLNSAKANEVNFLDKK